jgi:Tol biopolymer transport system component
MAPQELPLPGTRTTRRHLMATQESSAPAHPSTEDHDDTLDAHYACLERPCACIEGFVYVGHRVVGDDGDDDIYVTHADGSGTPKRITNGLVIDELSDDDTDIQWSPDCKKLAFAASGVIYIVNVSGEKGVTKPQRLTSKATTPASQPSWSPVGTEIVFTRGDTSTSGVPSHVYRMDADGSNVTRLTNFAWGKDLWPTWSPDGRKIAFVRVSNERDHSGEIRESSAIVAMDSDGSDEALLRNFTGRIVRNPDWHSAQHEKSEKQRPSEDG